MDYARVNEKKEMKAPFKKFCLYLSCFTTLLRTRFTMKASWRLVFFLVLMHFVFSGLCSDLLIQKKCSPFYLYAEKEEPYTSSDEFLPLGAELGEDESEEEKAFLSDNTLIKNAVIKGIKILREERKLIFSIDAARPDDINEKELKYLVDVVNFPPRIIIRLYGVTSEERVFKFFKGLDILGVVSNPFVKSYLSEYVIFFQDSVTARAIYDKADKQLSVFYSNSVPEFERGYGVRIADTRIDPLPQVVEIKTEIEKYGLEVFLLVASDYQTVVLESPFYSDREEAVVYIESLENFGYKGKLAIRNYKDFPEPHRFDVKSEVVITGQNEVNLKNLVYTEFTPEQVSGLSYQELFFKTRNTFSPSIRKEPELLANYYYKLSEIYLEYEAQQEDVKNNALLTAVKVMEIVYFYYPETEKADDALWEITTIIKEYGISDVLDEEECYRRIINEYPESIFANQARERLDIMRQREFYFFNRNKYLLDF